MLWQILWEFQENLIIDIIIIFVDAISSLGTSNSFDVYGMNSKIIKHVGDNIITPLSALFNQCLEECIFPDVLKISRVVPVFKRGSTEEKTNYRPVSVVPLVGFFLKILTQQISMFFKSNNFLITNQFEFRFNRSTQSAISTAIWRMVKGYENGLDPFFVICQRPSTASLPVSL